QLGCRQQFASSRHAQIINAEIDSGDAVTNLCRDRRVPGYIDKRRDYTAMNLRTLGVATELRTQGQSDRHSSALRVEIAQLRAQPVVERRLSEARAQVPPRIFAHR